MAKPSPKAKNLSLINYFDTKIGPEESLLVIRGLGIQTSTSSPTYLFRAQTRFIPTQLIQDLFIHEAFIGFSVRFYLAAVVSDEEDVVVVFPQILPKRLIIEEIWRGARQCLYEPTLNTASKPN